MHILRTADERFQNLADYPFAPNYLTITDVDGTPLRIHYIDEGPRAAPTILLMHGEPSWSYLYRNFIYPLVALGHRVIAPDLVGFGKSDKPAARTDYTYERHVAWMSAWLNAMTIHDISLFCQDWGGLIGLRLVAAFPDKFSRLIIGNTGLPIGTGWSEGFERWLKFSQNVPEFPVGSIVNGGTTRDLSAAEIAAYDAPFPDESYKAGARQFPVLVPITPEHASVQENIAAWKILEKFNKPVLTCFSDNDAVTKGGEAVFQHKIPGAENQPHVILKNAGHFLQEDQPEQLVALIHAFSQK
jgi:haloalkane dehalogenase